VEFNVFIVELSSFGIGPKSKMLSGEQELFKNYMWMNTFDRNWTLDPNYMTFDPLDMNYIASSCGQ